MRPKFTLVGRLGGAIDGHVEVSQVIIVGCRRDALYSGGYRVSTDKDGESYEDSRLVHQALRLLDNALGESHDWPWS